VLYRLYRREDFAALYAIEEECFESPFRFGPGYMRRLVNRSNAVTWIAEDEGKMAGFAIAELIENAEGVMAYIPTLEVAREDRCKGVGGALLRCLEGSATAVRAISIGLHVDASNGGAIRLYEAFGYLCEGRQADYYAPGKDALVYRKPLASPLGDR
jgi:ribosomal-protein-alanine N-acetyltransferase